MKKNITRNFECYSDVLKMLHDTYDTLNDIYFKSEYYKKDPDIFMKLVDEKYKHIEIFNEWYTKEEENETI